MEAPVINETPVSSEDNITRFITSILGILSSHHVSSHEPDPSPGNQSIDTTTLYPLTIIYSILAVIGLFGNLATVTVILSNKYMRYQIMLYFFTVV